MYKLTDEQQTLLCNVVFLIATKSIDALINNDTDGIQELLRMVTIANKVALAVEYNDSEKIQLGIIRNYYINNKE